MWSQRSSLALNRLELKTVLYSIKNKYSKVFKNTKVFKAKKGFKNTKLKYFKDCIWAKKGTLKTYLEIERLQQIKYMLWINVLHRSFFMVPIIKQYFIFNFIEKYILYFYLRTKKYTT